LANDNGGSLVEKKRRGHTTHSPQKRNVRKGLEEIGGDQQHHSIT